MLRALLAIGLVGGCAAASPSAPGAPPASQQSTAPEGSASAAELPPPERKGASPSSPAAPAPLGFTFSRANEAPVSSLALGKPPKVAFLSTGAVLVFDGGSFRTLSASETRAPELSVELFFGRDDEPRLMGYRRPSGGGKTEPFYRRYKAGRFQPEPGELGPLAGPGGALYGVLGHADPEVVCRPGLFCLVKRISGWSRAPAHAEPVRILLAAGTAFALHRDRIERLDAGSWVPLRPERAWDEPASLFVDGEGSPWIVETKRDLVTHLHNGAWGSEPSPVRGARAIFGTSARDVWLVGAGGAAHFDGATWSPVPGVSGPLALVAFSQPDLWLAGEGGVFRGSPVAGYAR